MTMKMMRTRETTERKVLQGRSTSLRTKLTNLEKMTRKTRRTKIVSMTMRSMM
jgi:hypothetical protein